MINWVKGRHGTGYYKYKLFESTLLGCDLYILKYPKGSYVPIHVDPVMGYEHHRINLTVWWSGEQGYPYVDKNNKWCRQGWAYKFRPDIMPHVVATKRSGVRYVLSIGWLGR